MNRRDFLRLTVKGQERILELSCERLYMRYIDAQAGVGLGSVSDEHGLRDREWDGEPPLDVVVPSMEQLFSELERRLSSTEVLRVIGPEWLAGDDFRREVESRIEGFRMRGGRVE